MKKTLKYLELIAAVLFVVTYVEMLVVGASAYLDFMQGVQIISPFYFYITIFYFLLMALISYLDSSESRWYPILFLLVIVVILFLPFDLSTIYFIPVYVYYQQKQPMRDAVSFLVVGQFLRHLLPLVSFAILLYGWLRYVRTIVREELLK